MENPKSSKTKTILANIPPVAWFYIIGIPVVIGGVYFLIARPIMKKLNLIETQEDKETKKIIDITKRQPFWNASWYVTHGGNTLNDYDAGEFAQQLIDAMGSTSGWYNPYSWGTNETAIYSVFGLLGSKGNISKVVEQYNIRAGQDLYADLESELAEDEMLQIAQKISMYQS